MSDQAQGPGWWRAADGKWYPPATPQQQGPTPAPPAQPSWWRRPIALWIAIVAGFAGFAVGAVAGAGGQKDEKKSTAAVTTTTSATTTTTTTTTTTAPTTTTSTIPPTTLDPKTQFVADFASTRETLVSALETDTNVQSVDKVVFEDPTDSVLIDVTSTWASPDNQATGAWEMTRDLAALWKPGSGFNQTTYVPNLHLVNSGTSYQCSADFMARLATSSAGRSDWEAEC